MQTTPPTTTLSPRLFLSAFKQFAAAVFLLFTAVVCLLPLNTNKQLLLSLSSSVGVDAASECWKEDNSDHSWWYDADTTTNDAYHARALCDSFGMFLPSGRNPPATASEFSSITNYWAGVVVPPHHNRSTNTWHYADGTTPEYDWSSAITGAIQATDECFYAPGGGARFARQSCKGGPTRAVLCQLQVDRHDGLSRWHAYPSMENPLMAGMVLPFRVRYQTSSQPSAARACAYYGGEIGYVSNNTMAINFWFKRAAMQTFGANFWPSESPWRCKASSGTVGAIFMSNYRCESSSYKSEFGACHPYGDDEEDDNSQMRPTNAGGISTTDTGVGSSNPYPILCSRLIDQVQVSWNSGVNTCDTNKSASLDIKIKRAASMDLRVYIVSLNPLVARPVLNEVVFLKGSAAPLTQTVKILCAVAGTARFNVTLDLAASRWNMGRKPEWTSPSNQITVSVPSVGTFMEIQQTSITLFTGQSGRVRAQFPSSGTSPGTLLVTPDRATVDGGCVLFAGSATFTLGEASEWLSIVAGRESCSGKVLRWVVIVQSAIVGAPVGFTISVTVNVKHKLEITRQGSGTIDLVDSGWDGGGAQLAQFNLNDTDPSSSDVGVLVWNVSTCTGTLVPTVYSRNVGTATTLSVPIYANEIAGSNTRTCFITFYLNDTAEDMWGRPLIAFPSGATELTIEMKITRLSTMNATWFPLTINQTTGPLSLDTSGAAVPADITFSLRFPGDSRLTPSVSSYSFPLNDELKIAVNNPTTGARFSHVVPSWESFSSNLRKVQYQYGLPKLLIFAPNQAGLPRFRLQPTRLYTEQDAFFFLEVINWATSAGYPHPGANKPVCDGMTEPQLKQYKCRDEDFTIFVNCTGAACATQGGAATYSPSNATTGFGQWATYPVTTIKTGATPGMMTVYIYERNSSNNVTVNITNTSAGNVTIEYRYDHYNSNWSSVAIPYPSHSSAVTFYKIVVEVSERVFVTVNTSLPTVVWQNSSNDPHPDPYTGRRKSPLIIWIGPGDNPIESGGVVTVTPTLANTTCASIYPSQISLTGTSGAQAFFVYASDYASCVENSVSLHQTSTDPGHHKNRALPAPIRFSVAQLFNVSVVPRADTTGTFALPSSTAVKVEVTVRAANGWLPWLDREEKYGIALRVYLEAIHFGSGTLTATLLSTPGYVTLTRANMDEGVNVTVELPSSVASYFSVRVSRVEELIVVRSTSAQQPEWRFSTSNAALFRPKTAQAAISVTLAPSFPLFGNGVYAGVHRYIEVFVDAANTLPANSTVTISGSAGLSFDPSSFVIQGGADMAAAKAVRMDVAAATTSVDLDVTVSIAASVTPTENAYLTTTNAIKVVRIPTQKMQVLAVDPFPSVLYPFDRAVFSVRPAPSQTVWGSTFPSFNTTQEALPNENQSAGQQLRVSPSAPFTLNPRQSNPQQEIVVLGVNESLNQTLTTHMYLAAGSSGSFAMDLPQQYSIHVEGRQRMAPYLDDLPEEIFVGAANAQQVTVYTGPGLTDVTFQMRVIDLNNNNNVENAANFFNPSSFTVTGREANTGIKLTYSGPASYDNISVSIVPVSSTRFHIDPTDQYALNHFWLPPRSWPSSIFGLRNWNVSLDSTVLYGPRDYIKLTFSLEVRARANWDVMATVNVNNTRLNVSSILESYNVTVLGDPDGYFARFQNLAGAGPVNLTLFIRANQIFDFSSRFLNVNHYLPVYLLPNIMDWVAAKYRNQSQLKIWMSRTRNITRLDSDPFGTIFAGPRGSKRIRIIISDLPKPGRTLVVRVEANCSLVNFTERVFYWTSDNASKVKDVYVTTDEPERTFINVTIVVDEQESTALEYLPTPRPQPHLVLQVRNVIPIRATRNWEGTHIPTTSTTRYVNFTTDNMFLTFGKIATMQLDCSDKSVLVFDPPWNVTYINIDEKNGTNQRYFDASGFHPGGYQGDRRNVTLSYPYTAPIIYTPGPPDENITVFVPRSINITTLHPRKFYRWARFGAYYVDIDVPEPYDTYVPPSFKAVRVTITCNVSCVQWYPATAWFSGSTWSRRFNYTVETAETCVCTFRFTSNGKFLMEEYTNPEQTVVFRGYDRVPLQGSSVRTLYQDELQSLTLFTPGSTPLNQICEVGDILYFNLTANETKPPLVISPDSLYSQTVDGSSLRFEQKQSYSVLSGPRTIVFTALQLNSTKMCYGIDAAAFSIIVHVVVRVPVYIYMQPARAYIDNTTESFLAMHPPSEVPIRDVFGVQLPSMKIDIWYNGPASSINVANNRTATEYIDMRQLPAWGNQRFQNWTLTMQTPKNGTTTTVSFTITGMNAQEIPQNLSCRAQDAAAQLAFSECIVVGSSGPDSGSGSSVGLIVPRLMPLMNTSSSVEVLWALKNASLPLFSSGNRTLAKLLVGETFDIIFRFTSDDARIVDPRTVVTTDSRFLTVSGPSAWTIVNGPPVDRRDYRYTFTVVNSSFNFLGAADSAGIIGGFMLNIRLVQNVRRFVSMNGIRIVTYFKPKIGILPGAPDYLRVNRANSLNFTLALDRPPRRYPVTVNLFSSTGLVFSPASVLFRPWELINASIEMWGTYAQANASVIFTFSIPEMVPDGPTASDYRVQVLDVGALYVTGFLPVMFEDQQNIIQLRPDFKPLSQPLLVTIRYNRSGHISVGLITDGMEWLPGTAGAGRSVDIELSTEKATNRLYYPVYYEWTSTEYDRVVCLPEGQSQCQTLSIWTRPTVDVVLDAGESNIDKVLFPGEWHVFQVFAKSCSGATVEATIDLPEFDNVVIFSPPKLLFVCANGTVDSAPQNVNVSAYPSYPNVVGDPTDRSTAVESQLKVTIVGVPPVSGDVQLKMKLAVHAPMRADAYLSSNITYTGSFVTLFVVLPRKPAKGIVQAAVTVQGGEAAAMPRWNTTAEDYGANPALLRKEVTINVPRDRDAGTLTISVALTGLSRLEYILNTTQFTVEVRLPVKLGASSDYRIRRFIEEQYELWVWSNDVPETNTSIRVFLNASVWKPTLLPTDPLEPLLMPGRSVNDVVRWITGDTVEFLDNATVLNVSSRFYVTQPCIVTFSFHVSPTRRQFNSTLQANDVLMSRLEFETTDKPEIVTRPAPVQFVLERNTQTFSVRVAFLPLTGFLEFRPTFETVYDDPGTQRKTPYAGPQNPPLFSPAKPAILTPTSKERVIIFFLWNNSATAPGLTTNVFVTFSNASTGQYNVTRLFVGSVRFVPLHTVLPLQSVYGVSALQPVTFTKYIGIPFEVPCMLTGLPPINTTYEIGIGGQTGSLTIAPETVKFGQFDHAATKFNISNVNYYRRTFTIIGDKESASIVRFVSKTKIAAATMFDAGDVQFTVRIQPPLSPVLYRLGPLFGGSGTGGPAGGVLSDGGGIELFVGAVNAQQIKLEMPKQDPSAGVITVRISTTAGENLISLTPSTFTFGAQEAYPASQTFKMEAKTGHNASVTSYTFSFRVEGSSIYASETSLKVTVTERYLFAFKGLPMALFAGEGNARTITIAPEVVPPTALQLDLRVQCSEVTVTPSKVKFNNSKAPQTVTVVGIKDSNPCLITASQNLLTLSATFEMESIRSEHQVDTVTVYAAPELVSDIQVGGQLKKTIPASLLRTQDVAVTLSLFSGSVSRFVPTKNMTIDFKNESSITMTSSLTASGAPAGLVAQVNSGQLRTVIEVSAAGTSVTLTLKRSPTYTVFDNEVVAFRLNYMAIANGTLPNPAAAGPVLTILPDERLPPKRSARVATASVGVTASFLSGLASATAAGQTGYLFAAASVADCPSATWMLHIQENMPAYVSPMPIPLAGISNEELGGFGGALVGNLLIVLIWTVLHGGMVLALKRVRGIKGYKKSAALLRFPGLLWLPTILLLQPSVALAALLLLYSPRTDMKGLGAVGIILGAVAVPFAAFRVHSKSAPLEYEDPPSSGSWLVRFLKRGTYDHPEKPYWVNMYSFPLQALRRIRRWYFMLEIWTLILLGFIAGLQPKESKDCIMRALALLALLVSHLLIVVIAKPYSALLDTVFWTVGYILQIVAIILVITAQSSTDTDKISEAYDQAGTVLSAFAVLFLIYGLISICYLVVEILQRCEDPRDPSMRKKKVNQNISQFAEELRRMDLSGGGGGGVSLGANAAAASAGKRSDGSSSDDDDDDDSSDDDNTSGAGTRGDRGKSVLPPSLRFAVTATPADRKAGVPARTGFHRAFEPAVMALDGGHFDARERDRRMAEEVRVGSALATASLYSPSSSSSPLSAHASGAVSDYHSAPAMSEREALNAWGITDSEQAGL